MKKFIKKHNFKKIYLGDHSGYWYSKSKDTIIGEMTFAFVDDGGINTIDIKGTDETGKHERYLTILHTKSFKKFKKEFKKINKQLSYLSKGGE